ncbi:MAG: hypothetical protein Phog2KO_44900 [Phototrophicaceae bacterium]
MTRQNQSKPLSLKTLSAIFVGLIIGAGLLLADLQFHGLAWQWFYSQTGEEGIAGQIQGMIEVSGNWIRSNPNTAPNTPIQHTDIFPYGINTFFEQETQVDKMRVQFEMIQTAGFGWIRQEFPWEDIEVDGRGEFTDTREDYDGDDIPDTISAWDKYDNIVALVQEHDLDMIVRLSNPPAWSRENNPETLGGALAPPDDYQDFVNYAVAVAERYQGQINYYQVWNEPNIYPEWGETFVNPADYTRLLCMTYDALKAVDPNIVVISGTIAPTDSLDGYYGYHDLLFLQNMYENGAGDCFDVLSAQGYGLNSGPTDRRQRVTHLSYARHIQYRDIMVNNGDAHKPIWLSEVAWSPMLEPCLETGECVSTDDISGAFEFGAVTNEQAGRYLVEAYDRAQEEWSWIGHITYWHFTRPSINDASEVMYWFRMVEADYSDEHPSFSPLPVYESARDYLTRVRERPVMYQGVHQAESWEVTMPDSAELMMRDGAQFGDAVQTDRLSFRMNGTGMVLRIRTETPIIVMRDGLVVMTISPDPTVTEWQDITINNGLVSRESQIELSATDVFIVDSIAVQSQFWLNVMPVLCGLGAVLMAILVIGYPQLAHRRTDQQFKGMQGRR